MTTFKFHPKPPASVAPIRPPAKISPQRCHKCDRKMTPGEKAKIHEQNPIAWCLDCSGELKRPDLFDAVVVDDEENLAGDSIPSSDGSGDPAGAAGATGAGK